MSLRVTKSFYFNKEERREKREERKRDREKERRENRKGLLYYLL